MQIIRLPIELDHADEEPICPEGSRSSSRNRSYRSSARGVNGYDKEQKKRSRKQPPREKNATLPEGETLIFLPFPELPPQSARDQGQLLELLVDAVDNFSLYRRKQTEQQGCDITSPTSH